MDALFGSFRISAGYFESYAPFWYCVVRLNFGLGHQPHLFASAFTLGYDFCSLRPCHGLSIVAPVPIYPQQSIDIFGIWYQVYEGWKFLLHSFCKENLMAKKIVPFIA